MVQADMEILILAALLHDIGKFAQRANRPKSANLEGEYCPSYQGRASHLHVLYTDFFIENDLPLPPELEQQRAKLARLASAHHKPAASCLAEQILKQADGLSAGMDRAPQEEHVGDYKSARLLSVFSQVNLFDGEAPQRRYHTLAPITEAPFPANTLQEAQAGSYAELFASFLASLANLPLNMGVRHYTASLVSLLEQFTWCIPSSTYNTEPDISLYDHAVTTAAIAQALAVYYSRHAEKNTLANHSQAKFLLVGGDLSGIQSYIFGIEKSHGSGTARLLRARSFHLQTLTHSVVLALLDEAKLFPQAKIMDAGGRFVLILPAVPEVEELLPRFANKVQSWFLEEFKGRLSLTISHTVRMSEADFHLQKFHTRLDELFDDLDLRKTRKFSDLLGAGRLPVASLADEDFSPGACAICRINPVSDAASTHYERQTGKQARLCAQCEGQISRIGMRLPQKSTRFAMFSRGKSADSVALFGGIHLSFIEKVEKLDKEALDIMNLRTRGQFTYRAIAGHLPHFAPGDEARWQYEGRKSSEEESVTENSVKTFSQMAQEARIADGPGALRGKAFLGALKADVDNLGMVFSVGFGDKLSISRFAGLSRMLNHFFAEVMVKMIRDDSEYHDIYVVFAGGDDLFLIGPWHQLMRFAQKLEAEFNRYVANNSSMSLSAGIFISKPTLPANTIARNAEALLKEAKAYQHPGKLARDKDAINVLGVTAGWAEYARLLQQGHWLENLVLDGHVPSALIRRLLNYADDCAAFLAGHGGRRRGMYRSHMRYDFARNLGGKTLLKEDKEKLEALGADPGALCRMRLPISYALYRIRTE